MKYTLVAALTALAFGPASAAVYGGCKFDTKTLKFSGTTEQVTICLLKKVRPKGGGADIQTIPAWLTAHVGQPVSLTTLQMNQYLQLKGVNASDLGETGEKGSASDRQYFVIHDTSSPELSGVTEFPGDIDSPNYSGNKLSGWPGLAGIVNMIISRDGRSRTIVPWADRRTGPAVKIERQNIAPQSKRIFVHVENIQPRIKSLGSWGWKAPAPGFSTGQEERLALAYVAASLSAGRWLIPAYHFNIDQGIPDGHDDPQNADLPKWVERIQAIEKEISAL